MKKRIERIVLGILLLSLLGAGTMTAAAATPGIYINGEDVTDQFTDDPASLKGSFVADSSNVYLANMYAEFYLPYVEQGYDVSMYYNGPYTTRITIGIGVTADGS